MVVGGCAEMEKKISIWNELKYITPEVSRDWILLSIQQRSQQSCAWFAFCFNSLAHFCGGARNCSDPRKNSSLLWKTPRIPWSCTDYSSGCSSWVRGNRARTCTYCGRGNTRTRCIFCTTKVFLSARKEVPEVLACRTLGNPRSRWRWSRGSRFPRERELSIDIYGFESLLMEYSILPYYILALENQGRVFLRVSHQKVNQLSNQW